VQFVKGGDRSSELSVLERLGVRVERPAERRHTVCSGRDPRRRSCRCAEAWSIAKDALSGDRYDLVVLDEINVAMRYGLVETDDVLAVLDARHPTVEVVLTGRGAPGPSSSGRTS